MIKKVIASIKKHGSVKEATKRGLWKWLGIDKMNANLQSLNYFLDAYNDITKLPPTTNEDLRILQICDAEILHIFDAICKQHEFTYWLYAGSLLGAIRHKGFIPWDDDTDVCMPRESYNRALEIFPKVCKENGLYFDIYQNKYAMVRIGFGYKHWQTGIWIDVFPTDDFFSEKHPDEISKEEWLEKDLLVRSHYLKNRSKETEEQLIAFRNKVLGHSPNNKYHIIYDGMEFEHHNPRHYDYDEIYPLSKVTFEGYEFNAPRNPIYMLKKLYNNYLGFPKNGVAIHGTSKGAEISQWAKIHHVDMNEALAYLKDVYKNISTCTNV